VRILCPVRHPAAHLSLPFQRLLRVCILNAGDWIRENPGFPQLYRTKVQYKHEPWAGQGNDPIEEFAHPIDVLVRGWGDCDDLVIWRGAELIAQGFECHARILKRDNRYHTQLTRDFDGIVEDPSLQRLGKPYCFRLPQKVTQ